MIVNRKMISAFFFATAHIIIHNTSIKCVCIAFIHICMYVSIIIIPFLSHLHPFILMIPPLRLFFV